MRTLAALLAFLWAPLAAAQDDLHVDPELAVRTCGGSVTDECIVREFKDTMEASVIRGRSVYQYYCTLCHGPEGKGDGRAARLYTPPPFDLTASLAPREYAEMIIRKGGEPLNRGAGMPPWGEQLTDEQINDLLNFLFTIRTSS
jgi:mono/diheme cytochrome c family protein